jgi:peptidase inhibitor family I36
MIRKKSRVVAVGLLLAGMMGATAQSASAGDGLCDLSFSCIYQDLNYDGGVLGSAMSSKSLWGNLKWNDKATSLSANGQQCKYTNYFEHASNTNGAPYGDAIQMFSRSLMGTNYRDPDLQNGAGNRTGQDWNDRISGFTHSGC